jgi:hypothetical protein
MKNALLIGLALAFGSLPGRAADQNSAQDLKTYLSDREQVKALELPALKAMTADAHEKNAKRGIAAYYTFLKTRLPDGDIAAAKSSIDALEASANTYMDPLAYVKLAVIYSRDNPTFGIKQDETKALQYLSIAWELADLSDRATGDNALLTLIINNTLGLGDGFVAENASGKFAMKQALDTVRPAVLKERERFKKLYNLSVKDEFPGSTNVERHYGN